MGDSGVATSLECVNGHDVAVASEGHVHLLHTGRLSRKGAQRGDSDASIRARRSFFDLGGYAEQVAAVASAVVDALPPSQEPLNILDAGCGEGRYLREVDPQASAVLIVTVNPPSGKSQAPVIDTLASGGVTVGSQISKARVLWPLLLVAG